MPTSTIAPIGTCRLHTPLRRGALRYGYRLHLTRNYGFTHTSSEALQQLRYMLGEISFPADIARLICRPTASKAQGHKTYEIADLYLIEISSAKLVTCRDFSVQLNYVYRYFAEFFSDRDRTRWFWLLANDARASELAERLNADPAFNRLNASDKALLADLRQAEVTTEILERDVAGLVQRLGGERMVLVTHVNAQLSDGSVIASRSRLIDDVTACAARLGVRCFDPTPMMHLLGQTQAMEKFGLDLTHFTERFSDQLCAALHANFMTDAVEGDADHVGQASPAARQLAIDLETAWQSGDVLVASRDLRRALAADPSAPELRQLLGKMQFELGDYKAAETNLELARDSLGSDSSIDRMLMLVSFELGKYEHALRFGEALLGDEVESPEILRTCAASATAVGRSETAANYWERLFWLDRSADAASAALGLLAASGDQDATRTWAENVLAVLPQHADALLCLWNDGVRRGDRERLLDMAPSYDALPVDQLLPLATAAAPALPLAAARLLSAAVARNDTAAMEWAVPSAADWTQRAADALSAGNSVAAIEPMQAASLLPPATLALVRGQRLLAGTLRIEARAALLGKDYDQVIAIGEEALATGFAFPEMNVFLGKAYLETGQAAAALRHLRIAAATDADPGAAYLQLGRSALRLEHYHEAFDACFDAQRSSDADVAEAAAKLLTGMTSRALKAVRALTSAGEYEQAWSLADKLLAHSPADAAALREKAAIVRAVRDAIAAVDKSDDAQRLHLARRLLALDPTDGFALRTAAVEAMRGHDFEASLHYWLDLKNSGSDHARLDINIEKCRLWVARQHRGRPALAVAA